MKCSSYSQKGKYEESQVIIRSPRKGVCQTLRMVYNSQPHPPWTQRAHISLFLVTKIIWAPKVLSSFIQAKIWVHLKWLVPEKVKDHKNKSQALCTWILQHSWEELQKYEAVWKGQRNEIPHVFGYEEDNDLFWVHPNAKDTNPLR